MFSDTYKKAYTKVGLQGKNKIDDARIVKWMEKEKNLGKRKRKYMGRLLRPVAAVAFLTCLIGILAVPVAAKNIPDFYQVLNRHAPALVDYLIPVQKTDSSKGITMTLEAVNIVDNRAEILVSFTDDGSGDCIHGEVDLYDSYNLYSFSGDSNIGGCNFMEYDKEQDKAYFKIDLTSSEGTFDKSRMELRVYRLLTDLQRYTREISLDNFMTSCTRKAVKISGRGGKENGMESFQHLILKGNENDPRPGHMVMDISREGLNPETMEITGILYEEEFLTIQVARGNFADADRHMDIYLLDEAGNRFDAELGVSWQEEIDGEQVSFEEYYFKITEEELKKYTLWGDGDVRAGSVEGDWKITFEVE